MQGRWWGLVALAVVVGAAIWLFTREARWAGPLYCIERPGQLWAGRGGALPPGWTPQCPDTGSYRAEVRRGESRVEQYRLSGWHPKALADLLAARGVQVLDAEALNDGLYETFLTVDGAKVYLLAQRQGGATLFTLSGRP